MGRIKFNLIAILSVLVSIGIAYFTSSFLGKTYYYSLESPDHDVVGIASYLITYFIVFPIMAGLLSVGMFLGEIKYLKRTGSSEIDNVLLSWGRFFIALALSLLIAYKYIWLGI